MNCRRWLASMFAVSFVAVWLAAFSSGAFAQSDEDQPSRFRGRVRRGSGKKVVHEEGKTVIYKKKNVVDFDDSLIEGDVRNPSEFYFTVRPSTPTKNLIDRRKNFHKEMLRDAVMIR